MPRVLGRFSDTTERDLVKCVTLTSSILKETTPAAFLQGDRVAVATAASEASEVACQKGGSWCCDHQASVKEPKPASPLAPLVLTCGRHPLLRIHPQCPGPSQPNPAQPALPDRG